MIIDKYAYANAYGKLHPAEKILFCAAMLLLCLVSRAPWLCLLIGAVMSLLITFGAKVPAKVLLRWVLAPMTFLLAAAIPVLIEIAADAQGMMFSAWLFGRYFGVTHESLMLAFSIMARSLGAIMCTYFLAFTTPMADVFAQLRAWRAPALFVEMMSLIYRFTFAMLDSAQKMGQSQILRLGYKDLPTAMRSMAALLGQILTHSFTRSRALADALECRLYTGEINVLSEDKRRSIGHEALFAALTAVAATLTVTSYFV